MTACARVNRVGSALVIALVAATSSGCGGGSEPQTAVSSASCPSRFSWDGQRYAGRGPLKQVPRITGTLGRGEIRGCDDQPVQPATVFKLDAVGPTVAVLLRTDENPQEPLLWTIRGTLVESARHPLHEALFAADQPNPVRDHRCGPSRTLTVRVIQPTRQDFGPKVAPADGVTGKRFLMNRRIGGYISIAAHTRLLAADRRGVPFVGRDDLLRIRARGCRETAKYRAEHHGSRNRSVVVDGLRVLKRG